MKCNCLICGYNWNSSWDYLSKSKGCCPVCIRNGEKITKNEMIERLELDGFKLVEFTELSKTKGTMMIIQCSEGHKYETSYRKHNYEEHDRSGSCKECSKNRIGSGRRKNQDDVIKDIKKLGYSVEDGFTYKNNREVHQFTCENGHVRKITYFSLNSSPNCPECTNNIQKYTEEHIKTLLGEMGIEYISGFTTTKSPFIYRCECGEIAEGYFYRLRDGSRCLNCSPHKFRTFEEVQKIYSDAGCILLETSYENNIRNKLKFQCKCGNIYEKEFASFLISPRCGECAIENRSGENSPNWNPDLTDEERENNRKNKEYKHWRLAVYERDNYSCQCCGDNKGGNLNAHHLNSHDWAKEDRLDIDNGITLCVDCHTEFHHQYGFGNNTKEQFEEYMNNQQPLNNAI
jgi:hypothetical protein